MAFTFPPKVSGFVNPIVSNLSPTLFNNSGGQPLGEVALISVPTPLERPGSPISTSDQRDVKKAKENNVAPMVDVPMEDVDVLQFRHYCLRVISVLYRKIPDCCLVRGLRGRVLMQRWLLDLRQSRVNTPLLWLLMVSRDSVPRTKKDGSRFSVLGDNSTNPQPILVVEGSRRVRRAQMQSSQVVVIPTITGSKPLVQNHVPSLAEGNHMVITIVEGKHFSQEKVQGRGVDSDGRGKFHVQLDGLISHEGVASMAMGGSGPVQFVDTVQADYCVAMADAARMVIDDGRVVSGKENSTPNL
ncbi:hypothetical protein V6N11_001684 [Hibiscus sabdariffa]|uniref:Uncharacterized protein n=2 Tax=Hibiscus sabdariffa TaxID=183260 RepID=A0ABR1Z900_9ROSI